MNNSQIKAFTEYKSGLALRDDGVCAYVLTCPEEPWLEKIERIIRSIGPVEDTGA